MKIAIMTALVALNLAAGCIWPNPVSSILATVLFAVSLLLMFLAEPVSIWLMLPFVVGQFSVLVSLNFAEGGAYLVEMGQAGHASPAAVTYCCYALIMLLVALGTLREMARRRAASGRTPTPTIDGATLHPFFHIGFLAVAYGWVTYLIIAGLRTGFPLLSGMDRFYYRRVYADIVTLNLLDLQVIPAMALGLAVAVAKRPGLRLAYSLAYVLLVADSFLFGDKFFIVVMSGLAFSAPFLVRNAQTAAKTLLRLSPFLGAGFLAAALVTIAIYSATASHETGGRGTLVRLADRVAGQGELWFMAVQQAPPVLAFDEPAVGKNLASILQNEPSDFLFRNHLSAFYFIFKYSPPKMFRSFLHNAGTVTPTMVYEAYGLILFGWLGLLLQMVISGSALALVVAYVRSALSQNNPFLVFLPAFVLNESIKFFAQATVYSLISTPLAKQLAAFVAMQFVMQALSAGLRTGESPNRRLPLNEAVQDKIGPVLPRRANTMLHDFLLQRKHSEIG